MNRLVAAVSLCGSSALGPAFAQETLTLDDALARARAHSPAVLAARARVEEARARVRGAGRALANPEVEAAAGRRHDTGRWDLDIGLTQPLEIGGRRGARVDAAEASLARELATAEDALRRAHREVAGAYLSAASAQERGHVAASAVTFAEDILRIARRRHEHGDVAALDVNVAQSGLARARSEVLAIGAEEAAAFGSLRSLLALDPQTSLVLDVEAERPAPEVAALVAAATDRPDVRALEAELKEAEADERLGKSLAWPDLAASFRYERDEGADVFWGGITFSLPLRNRGQETREVALARATRIRGELEALRLAVRNEIGSSWTVYTLREKAAAELRAQVAALDENDALARRSYEVGQIGLGELLLLRRETADARSALLERLAEAAEARIDLETRAGVLR